MKKRERKHSPRTRIPVDASPGPLHTLDGAVVTAAALLGGLGLVMVYSTTAPLELRSVPSHFVRQLVATLVAVGVIAAVMRVPLRAWQRLGLPLWGVSIALLVLTVVAGVRANGAQRWLTVPGIGFTFQPVEFAKWATLLAACAMLALPSGRERPARNHVLYSLGLAALPALLLLLQPDLGNAVILLMLVAVLLFVAGTPIRFFVIPGAVGALGLATYIWTHPYALDRLRGFWEPWATADRQGFQLVQSFVAFSRGGIFGVGLGDGRQKLFYLPEAHTDFILSVVAEELGLFGVLLVLGTFAALVVAGCRIARAANDRFATLMAFSMTAFLVVPALVNAAVVMGLLPTKGLALPFLSYGRSGLLMAFVAIGILLAIARQSGEPAAPPIRGAQRREVWSL